MSHTLRRIITGHNDTGQSIIEIDGGPATELSANGSGLHEIWLTESIPADNATLVDKMKEAGVGPKDVSVAEVHDATSFGELFMAELLGFCEFGEGGDFAVSGATALAGSLPINPSGGLLSKGHPIGATGIGQVFELVTQLRGEAGKRQVEGAKVAIQENGGGLLGVEEGAAVINIFHR